MITEQKHGGSSIKTGLSQHLLHIFSPVSERIGFGDFNLEEFVIWHECSQFRSTSSTRTTDTWQHIQNILEGLSMSTRDHLRMRTQMNYPKQSFSKSNKYHNLTQTVVKSLYTRSNFKLKLTGFGTIDVNRELTANIFQIWSTIDGFEWWTVDLCQSESEK